MHIDENDVSRLLSALRFSAEKHKNQKRKDKEGSPYINHPIKVAETLWNQGNVREIDIIIAALLHDTVEDTDATIEDIKNNFGEKVALYVSEVTDDRSLPKEERKRLQIEHAATISNGSKHVKLSDKICNVCDMGDSPPADWDKIRRQKYLEWSNKVVDGLRGTNENLEKMFDECLNNSEEKLKKS